MSELEALEHEKKEAVIALQYAYNALKSIRDKPRDSENHIRAESAIATIEKFLFK
jgi:hypothetical protein